jgi:hypothetical protein
MLALTRLDGDPELLRLPTSVDDRWAWVSYAAKTALACWLFAWAGRRCVRDWTDDWDLRIWPVAVAIALALVSLGDDKALTLAGFALVVVVARNVALVPRPAPRWQLSRWERVGLLAAVVVAATVALAYRPLHPLAAAFLDRGTSAGMSIGGGGSPSQRYSEFAFWMENEGPAGVTIRSIHAYDAAPADVDVLAHSGHPMGVERIAHDGDLRGRLQLAYWSCHGPYRVHSDVVTELVVRYETLGFNGTQRLPIDPPVRLRCPTRH